MHSQPNQQTASVVSASTDGRRERTEITRQRILESARELILAGKSDPTAEAIARRSGITRRTLFRHFKDMQALHREIILDAQAYAQSVMNEPFADALRKPDNWETRLQTVIERRVRIYEYLLPLHISSLYQRYRSNATEKAIHSTVQRRRKRLLEILPPGVTNDSLLFESLDAILSIEFWITLRQDQQLSTSRATQVLQHAVRRITHSPIES
ncbi:MAG: TetR/AcrR family transcriptional regulator [Pseudomonadota bacterium]|nr:TetR/AcrR family transcriptional regulator [Pseudomonadota bacterium]